MKFIARTDVHITDKKPASWKGDYYGEILDSLKQVRQLAVDHGATAVLDGGDFFHFKSPMKNPHGLVREVIDHHRGYPCPVFTVEGNHDQSNQSLTTIPSQPLGVVLAAGAFQLLREEVFMADGLQVRVVGLPYIPDRSRESIQVRKKPGDTHLILVVHALAGENPPSSVEDFFGEPVFKYDEFAQVIDGPDLVFLGHWHKDQGVVTLDTPSGQCTFVNTGSLSRGALIRENLERIPKAAVIEVTHSGVVVTQIPLSVAPAVDVFDIDRKEQRDQERDNIEAFVQKLRIDLTSESTDLVDSVRKLGGFDTKVVQEAVRYLEEVG